jgi:hypothetical protein
MRTQMNTTDHARRHLPLIGWALLLTLTLGGCASFAPLGGLQGSGARKTETRAVSSFSRLDLSGIGTVNVSLTGTESLTITTDDNILPLLTSSVSGSTLTLGLKPGTLNVRPSNGITWNLTVKDLTAITLSGAGNINAQGLRTTSFSADVSGAGTLTISGAATSQTVDISGAGSYQARAFATTNTTAEVSGTGSAYVSASGTLDATVSGVGSIIYYGSPQVTQHVSGVGSVKQGT